MIDRIEYLAQMGRLRLTPPALARKAGVSVNTVRNFLAGGDIRLSHLTAIAEALSGDVTTVFAQVTEPGRAPDAPHRATINVKDVVANKGNHGR